MPVHLEEHTESGEATRERSDDHAPGAGIEITEHSPDCSAAFTVRSFAGYRVFSTLFDAIMGFVTPTDLTQCSATELLELYRRGEASPVEATQAVLERIDAIDSRLNAFCLVAHDEAHRVGRAPARRAGSAASRWARSTASRRRSRT